MLAEFILDTTWDGTVCLPTAPFSGPLVPANGTDLTVNRPLPGYAAGFDYPSTVAGKGIAGTPPYALALGTGENYMFDTFCLTKMISSMEVDFGGTSGKIIIDASDLDIKLIENRSYGFDEHKCEMHGHIIGATAGTRRFRDSLSYGTIDMGYISTPNPYTANWPAAGNIALTDMTSYDPKNIESRLLPANEKNELASVRSNAVKETFRPESCSFYTENIDANTATTIKNAATGTKLALGDYCGNPAPINTPFGQAPGAGNAVAPGLQSDKFYYGGIRQDSRFRVRQHIVVQQFNNIFSHEYHPKSWPVDSSRPMTVRFVLNTDYIEKHMFQFANPADLYGLPVYSYFRRVTDQGTKLIIQPFQTYNLESEKTVTQSEHMFMRAYEPSILQSTVLPLIVPTGANAFGSYTPTTVNTATFTTDLSVIPQYLMVFIDGQVGQTPFTLSTNRTTNFNGAYGSYNNVTPYIYGEIMSLDIRIGNTNYTQDVTINDLKELMNRSHIQNNELLRRVKSSVISNGNSTFTIRDKSKYQEGGKAYTYRDNTPFIIVDMSTISSLQRSPNNNPLLTNVQLPSTTNVTVTVRWSPPVGTDERFPATQDTYINNVSLRPRCVYYYPKTVVVKRVGSVEVNDVVQSMEVATAKYLEASSMSTILELSESELFASGWFDNLKNFGSKAINFLKNNRHTIGTVGRHVTNAVRGNMDDDYDGVGRKLVNGADSALRQFGYGKKKSGARW
jgi:hypothetical protein